MKDSNWSVLIIFEMFLKTDRLQTRRIPYVEPASELGQMECGIWAVSEQDSFTGRLFEACAC